MQEKERTLVKEYQVRKFKKRSKDRAYNVNVYREREISIFPSFFQLFLSCFIHGARARRRSRATNNYSIILALYKKFTLFIIKSRLRIFFFYPFLRSLSRDVYIYNTTAIR